MVFFADADWLVGKWIARTIHLRVADETKSRVDTLIIDHFSVYCKKIYFFLYLRVFNSVLAKVVGIYLYFVENEGGGGGGSRYF